MSTITAEQLGADEFEPGDLRLASIVQSGIEQVKSLPEFARSQAEGLKSFRDVGKAAVLGVANIPEVFRPSYWRHGDNKKSQY